MPQRRDPNPNDIERWARIRADAAANAKAVHVTAPNNHADYLAWRAGNDSEYGDAGIAGAIEACIDQRLSWREIVVALGLEDNEQTVARVQAQQARRLRRVVGDNRGDTTP